MAKTYFFDYPEVSPLTARAQKLIVFLHGVGSDGHDLISLVPFMQKLLPDYHFIAPHGIEDYDMAPFGRQWFSLIDQSPKKIDKLIKNNAPLIEEIINQRQQSLALTNAETIIFGFSQGAMIGVYLTLNQHSPYAATISCCGKLIMPENINNTSTPICLIHGANDDIIPASETQKMADFFAKNNIPYEKLIVDNLTHSIDAKTIHFAIQFLHKIV